MIKAVFYALLLVNKELTPSKVYEQANAVQLARQTDEIERYNKEVESTSQYIRWRLSYEQFELPVVIPCMNYYGVWHVPIDQCVEAAKRLFSELNLPEDPREFYITRKIKRRYYWNIEVSVRVKGPFTSDHIPSRHEDRVDGKWVDCEDYFC